MSNAHPKPQSWPATFNHPREFNVANENQAYVSWVSWCQELNTVLPPHPNDDGNTSDSDVDSDSDSETTSDEEDEDAGEGDVTEDNGPCPAFQQRRQEESKPIDTAQHATAPVGRVCEVTRRLARCDDGNEINGELQQGSREIEGLDAVRVFMAQSKSSSIRDPEVPETIGLDAEVISFCEHAQKSTTQAHRKSKRIAIVDDRSDAMSNSSASTTKILTVGKLKYRLSIQRYADPKNETSTRSDRHSDAVTHTAHSPTSATRKIVYISGMDADGIQTLCETAPRSQRPALMNLFYGHVLSTLTPELSVMIESNGYRHFHFLFQAPFCVLREQSELFRDTRLRRDGRPLRHSQTLNCIRPQNNPRNRWRLYMAQTSVLFTGLSNRNFTVYGVADDYYESDCRDSVERYRQESKGARGPPSIWDPIEGTSALTTPAMRGGETWDARDYFLDSVRHWLKRITDEWRQNVQKMEKEDNERVDDESHQRYLSQDSSSWNQEMLDTIDIFTTYLSKTVREWEKFEKHGYEYFVNDEIESGTGTSRLRSRLEKLDHIRQKYAVLGGFLKDLCELRSKIKRRITVKNHQSTQQVGQLAVLALVIAPLSIAATLFNVPQPVLGIPWTKLAFTCVFFVISAIILMIYWLLCVQERWTGCLQDIAAFFAMLELPWNRIRQAAGPKGGTKTTKQSASLDSDGCGEGTGPVRESSPLTPAPIQMRKLLRKVRFVFHDPGSQDEGRDESPV
ncbi:hypothetical protein QBC47DRAFT_83316 [Echria macrotheca]|uniref:Uncharacterized protein n=1 Tax=Echria macrotheca TaxID=438768 RepID=A0AAJ0B7V1_9PEZI|nr:hypothetical protein QBC47DRAFT_83316 [Echria macrotheca]